MALIVACSSTAEVRVVCTAARLAPFEPELLCFRRAANSFNVQAIQNGKLPSLGELDMGMHNNNPRLRAACEKHGIELEHYFV